MVIDYGGTVFLSVTGFLIPPLLFYLAVANDSKITVDGITSPSKAFVREDVLEHPSRSFSYIANLQFNLIHGKRAVSAKVVAVTLCGLLVAGSVGSIIMQLVSK